jgi:hypothetical protein
MLKSAQGKRRKRSDSRPVATGVESCCPRCEGQACHWCVCHNLDLEQDAGSVWLESRPSEGPRVGVDLVWCVTVRLECVEHGPQRVCVLVEQPVTWS